MTRQQFRMLVVLNQSLLFGGYVVQGMTDASLPPELQDAFGVRGSDFNSLADSYSLGDQLLYSLSYARDILMLLGAIGLCLGRRWGRMLYTISFIVAIISTPLWPFYVGTNWSVLLFALYDTTEGMILALVYFSHLRRMFERKQED
ncbi:MAG: hypothetical protein H7Z38_07265 [Rubrivivax sp.]|nr:hypothetical protein [Pyrinomonadaceae bacterium]